MTPVTLAWSRGAHRQDSGEGVAFAGTDYLSPVPRSVLVRCRRCGGEMNSDAARCPWCGQQRRFQTLLPLTIVVLVGIGLMFAAGFLRWEMVQETFAALFPG